MAAVRASHTSLAGEVCRPVLDSLHRCKIRSQMKLFWEKLGMLGPINKLVGHGLSVCDIAEKLTITINVQGCVAWLLHFFNFSRREDLVLRASNAADSTKLATRAA